MKKLFMFVAVMICLTTAGLCADDEFVRIHAAGGPPKALGSTGIYGHHLNAKLGHTAHFVVDRVVLESPAYGHIIKGDFLTGANGKPFSKENDIRKDLAHAIIESESKDGVMRLQVTRSGNPREVTILLDKLPDYSPTWPLNCKRTDAMLLKACEYLASQQLPNGLVPADEAYLGGCQSGLLWLGVGEPRYMENACRAVYWYIDWLKELQSKGRGVPWGPWGSSYGAVAVAEYYLMTGDRGVLPGLELAAKIIADGQMPSGGYTHGFYGGLGAGYGELNNPGMVCYMALVLAKKCGVKVDESKLRRAERYYAKFAPPLQNRYGDHMYMDHSLGYGTMNGKVAGLAVANYLNGHDVDSAGYALKSARSMDSVLSGHTGHFFNILWTPIGASLAPAKDSRRAMDQLWWYYTYSQTWRGAFECLGSKGKYEMRPNMTTAGIGLGLASWNRHLQIHGAPQSVFIAKLPAELAAARELHQTKQRDKAIAAVDAFLKKDGLDAETVRLANELRDKARYVEEGVVQATKKLDRLSSGGRLESRAYEVTEMLKSLKHLYVKDDPRVKAIEDRLPEPFRNIWTRGPKYYEAFKTLRELKGESWFPYGRMIGEVVPDVSLPPLKPDWQTVADMTADAENRKMLVAPAADMPKNWNAIAFDDKDWKSPGEATEGKRGREKPAEATRWLMRVTFDYEDLTPRRLRIYVPKDKRWLPSGSEVYLNGEMVMKANSRFGHNFWTTKGGFDLLSTTPELLRKGRNVLAVSAPVSKELWEFSLQVQRALAPSFTWTEVPGQDAEFRKLVAQRREMKPYYVAEKDTRTAKELIQAMTAEPSFMPEIYYALERYKGLEPDQDQLQKNIASLLTSQSWGGRWAGARLIAYLLTPLDRYWHRRMSEEEKDNAVAIKKTGKPIAKAVKGEIIKLLADPHPFVRCQAAETIATYGASAKAAIPQLLSLLQDVDGQTWWIRLRSLEALKTMPLDPEAKQAAVLAGLNDPNSYVRQSALLQTFSAKDEAVAAEATKKYQKEMIDQIFDAPHGMATSGTPKDMARNVLDRLSKDEIRPYLPRFLEAMHQPSGNTMVGSRMILVTFGEEVYDKLDALTQDKNERVRQNALIALHMMALRDDASPELVAKVTSRLKSAMASDNVNLADKAKRLLKQLNAKKDKEKAKKK